jgi:Flp pilus assembly pilin Flp
MTRRWQGLGQGRAGRWLRRRTVEPLLRFHRDERGDLLEYALVFAAIALPLMFLAERLVEVLADYFSMIAFYVSWPFL